MKEDIGKMISVLSNQIKRYIDRHTSECGLTGVQGRILHFILVKSSQDEVFQKDIEEEFNLRRSTATGILQLMEKNGVLRREKVPYDARLKSLIPTSKALELKKKVDMDIQNLEELLRKNIDPEKMDIFFKVMEQMSKNLDK